VSLFLPGPPSALEVPTLEGSLVRLERLSLEHAVDLAAAAEEDRSTYDFTRVPRSGEIESYLSAHFERAEQGKLAPFAQIRRSDGRAVGCTAFWDPRYWPGANRLAAIEIGWTWLAASAQGTGINLEAKLLLLAYAFERLRVARVDLKTDARNQRSRKAIQGIGATFEGVLRSWSESHATGEDGMLRDSAMFSVVLAEWPEVRASLAKKLDGYTARSA
jgi:RimJ/RimL family protein N-acetyltransferase